MDGIIARGQHTYIRRALRDDAELFCRWWANGKLMESVGFPDGIVTNKQKLEAELSAAHEKLLGQSASDRFVIMLDDTDIPIGECCFHELNLYNKSCEIGIKICELSMQGKGYGYDALKAFIGFLFEQFDLVRISLDTLLENTRAQALYKKLGFRQIGICKKVWRDEQGTFHDSVLMELLNS